METIEIVLYSFNELNQDAKANAINNYRCKMQNYGPDLDFFNEESTAIINNRGFKNAQLSYSLSNCQGDGLSFKCSYIDTAKFIKELWPNCKTSVIDALCNNVSFCSIGNNGRYAYSSANDIEMYLNFYKSLPNLEEKADQLHQHIITQYLNLCDELEKIGYEEIEYFYSDESIILHIEANEIQFTENGKQF